MIKGARYHPKLDNALHLLWLKLDFDFIILYSLISSHNWSIQAKAIDTWRAEYRSARHHPETGRCLAFYFSLLFLTAILDNIRGKVFLLFLDWIRERLQNVFDFLQFHRNNKNMYAAIEFPPWRFLKLVWNGNMILFKLLFLFSA